MKNPVPRLPDASMLAEQHRNCSVSRVTVSPSSTIVACRSAEAAQLRLASVHRARPRPLERDLDTGVALGLAEQGDEMPLLERDAEVQLDRGRRGRHPLDAFHDIA